MVTVKIYIPNVRLDKIGGGWTFTKNFYELAGEHLVGTVDECDIFFITGATLVKRHEISEAKDKGKKIVLRVDGVPEDARNRGTGWSRLRDYAKMADLVIYQSNFIKDTVGRLLNAKRIGIIYNGVDTNVFNATDKTYKEDSILYVNYRKGEQNKRVEEAIERFRYYKLDHPEAKMTFVGLFPKVIREWNFWLLDLKKGVDYDYYGVAVSRVELANIMREHEYIAFPSFADPCPNTLIEAMACGCKPLWINKYGGQHCIVTRWDGMDWSREHMVKSYLESFEGIL